MYANFNLLLCDTPSKFAKNNYCHYDPQTTKFIVPAKFPAMACKVHVMVNSDRN